MGVIKKQDVIDKIKKETLINYSVAVMADVAECARQEDAPIYEEDKKVDQWVRLSDVENAINKYLNWDLGDILWKDGTVEAVTSKWKIMKQEKNII